MAGIRTRRGMKRRMGFTMLGIDGKSPKVLVNCSIFMDYQWNCHSILLEKSDYDITLWLFNIAMI